MEQLMKTMQRCVLAMVSAVGLLATTSSAWAQITINELVVTDRTYSSSAIADTSEFLELYNAGASAVDISNWKIMISNLGAAQPGNTTTLATIPASTSIAAGGYYVI